MAALGVALTVALTVALLSPRADADEPAGVVSEPPAMRYAPTRTRLPILAGGLGLMGTAYGLSAASAAGWPAVPGSERLYIPVVGPWLALAETGCSPDDAGCDAILYMRGILYVVDGLTQLGGLGIAAEGIFMTTEADAAPIARTSLRFAPIVTAHAAGLGVVGSF
ncbi:MAG: hypothetical protein EXR75_02240 [Myxococcales bacterium]|nr:hypothetical protein [Myxococcales bacterium]